MSCLNCYADYFARRRSPAHVMAPHSLLHSFFFQAEDGIRDWSVTGVQTCVLPISYAVFCLKLEDQRADLQQLLDLACRHMRDIEQLLDVNCITLQSWVGT